MINHWLKRFLCSNTVAIFCKLKFMQYHYYMKDCLKKVGIINSHITKSFKIDKN